MKNSSKNPITKKKVKLVKRTNKREIAGKIGLSMLVALIVSLVVISIFPLYTIFLLELGLEPGVVFIAYAYLLVLAGFVFVFTDWYRPKWLIVTLISLGVLNFIGLLWLYTALYNLSPTL